MAKIKVKNNEQCRLKFTHIRGGEAELDVMMNPLTGDWLETHKYNGMETSYYVSKATAVGLVNNIVDKSKEKGLPCVVTIEPRKLLPDL